MAKVNKPKTHGEDQQAICDEMTLPACEGFDPDKGSQGRVAQIGAFSGDQLSRSARKALAKQPSRRMLASGLVAMCSWAAAPSLADTNILTVTITDETKINGVNGTSLWLVGGGGGSYLRNTGTNTFEVAPGSPPYSWTQLTAGTSGTVTINVPANIGSFIFQVAAAKSETNLPKFTGSALVGGYYMLGEITTGGPGAKSTFDTSNVDQFSIPSRWTCAIPTDCQFNFGGPSRPFLPIGNPLLGTDTQPTTAPPYKFTREHILRDFQTSYGPTAYGMLLIPDTTSKISNYAYLLNPTNATKTNPVSINNTNAINPNTNFLGGMKTAWDALTQKSFIVSGAAGGVSPAIDPTPISFYNYLATPASSLTPEQLGMSGGVASNSGTLTNVNYGNSIAPGSIAANATITGFTFTQCNQQKSTDPGCTTPTTPSMQDFILANPYSLSTQIVQRNVVAGNNDQTGISNSCTSLSSTGVVCPTDPAGNPQAAPSSTGYVYVSAKDRSRIQPGMFLANGNAAGVVPSPDTTYGPYSQVYISSIGNDINGRFKVSLTSPAGQCSTDPSKCLIPGTGATAAKWNTIVFSNTNVQDLAFSPQYQILGNAGAFAINANDIKVLCPPGTTVANGCNASTIVGNVRNQIVTALTRGSAVYRGSAVADAAPLFTGPPTSSTLPVNKVWGDPNAWFTQNDENGNPEFNIYAAYLHNSGSFLEASGSPDPTRSFLGSAYTSGFDENPTFNGQFPLVSQVQVPSKIDSSIQDSATISLTLTPWVTESQSAGCGSNLACWNGSDGTWSSVTAWTGSIVPTTTSIAQFSPVSASASGGSVTIDSPTPSIQAIEFLNGVGSFTFSGNALTLTGATGALAFAISNNSGADQIFNNALSLNANQPLAIAANNGAIVLTNDLSGANGWIKTGDDILEFRGNTPTQTGPISIREGTLWLTNADLSRSSSITVSPDGTIEGSGRLPGTGAGSVLGVISPGGGSNPYGKITFGGDLTIGAGSIAVFTDLSENPDQSDRIEVNGNLSISSNQTLIAATAPDDIRKGDSYTLIKYTGDRIQSGGIDKFASELLSPDTTIIYDDISKTIRLEVAGDPSPTGCIKTGSPEDVTDSVYTSICGGQLILNQSGIDSQNWSLHANPFGQINRINAFGNTTALTGVISDAIPGIPGNITFDNTAPAPSNIILTNANTYTGSTTVRKNVNLAVNGSIASSSGLSVESGGTVSGNGFLPATILNPGATIAPGNSIGTLTAAALDLNGGTINAEIQGPQNDRINVLGNVTNFVGNANLIPFGGGTPFPGFNYTIVSAPASVPFATPSSLTLNQSQVSSALLRAGTTLVQDPLGDPRSFTVQWRPNNPAGAVSAAMQVLGNSGSNSTCLAGSLDRAFSSLATAAGGNANSSGSAIGSTGFTTGQAAAAGMQPGFVDALNSLVQITSDSQLVAAVNSLSPQPYAAFQSVGLDTLKQQRESQLAQAGQCINNGWIINGKKAKNPLCAFAMAQNSTSSIRGGASLSSYNAGIFSSGFGLEYYPSSTWSIGGSYGYGTSYANNFSQAQAAISAAVNNVNLFSSVALSERWRLRGLLGYSNFNLTGSRSIAFLSGGSSLSASPNGNGFTAAIETDYAIPLTKATATTQALLKPLLGFAWGSYQQSGFSESGGPMSLNVNGNTANSFVTTAGLELSTSPIPINKSGTISLRPTLTVAYQVDALANNSANTSLSSTFSQASAVCPSCSTEGQNLGSSALNVAGGVDLQLSPSTSVYVNASYQAYSNASQFGYGGGLRMRF
jgi:uncharacterized protein with beta-barrel porin domain